MIIAELQGKIPSRLEDTEDILTSNVFSFFKYSDRILFQEYLNELGLNVSLNDSNNAEFIFWLSYDDGTEPDLVVICGKFYILFEAKLYSDFAPKTASIDSQIAREINMGKLAAKNDDKTFVYVAITAEYFKENRKYSKYENRGFRFIWTNWQTVANFIEFKLSGEDIIKDNEFANDLFSLLVKKRLRSYTGIRYLSNKFYHICPESVFYNLNTSKFKGEYSGFIDTLEKSPQVESYSKFYSKSFFKTLKTVTLNPNQTIFYHGD